MNVSQKTKSDFYSDKKYKIELLEKFKGSSNYKDNLINELKKDLENGFTLYTKRNLERFLKCYDDICDFAEQFVKLDDYYSKNNKYANSEELFCILYGEKLGKEKWAKKKSKIQGENNPWFNHGGKLSPFKKGSVNYSEESIKKASKNRSYNTTIDYYINKGYSKEEAILKLKERQTTFSLKKCIEKYGKNKGLEVWRKRQEKWQNTLKSKSQEEIDDINKRKSSGIGQYLDRSIKGSLYYIYFYTDHSEFWKIGITSKSINERFNLDKLSNDFNIHHKILFLNEYESIQRAYNEEQFILAKFNNKRIIVDIDGLYTTEAFNEDVLKEFYNETI